MTNEIVLGSLLVRMIFARWTRCSGAVLELEICSKIAYCFSVTMTWAAVPDMGLPFQMAGYVLSNRAITACGTREITSAGLS